MFKPVPVFCTVVLATLIVALALLPPQAHPDRQGDAAEKVADLLDRIIQPRFQDTTGAVFGMDRVNQTIIGHQSIVIVDSPGVPTFRSIDPADAALIKEANSYRRRYLIGFLHMAHVPGTPTDITPPRLQKYERQWSPTWEFLTPLAVQNNEVFPMLSDLRNVPDFDQMEITLQRRQQWKDNVRLARRWENTALAQLPRLRRGESVSLAVGDWRLFLRPVRADQAACLNCHTGAKRGDTLGVMLYAVQADT
jgi:hypothetical protein